MTSMQIFESNLGGRHEAEAASLVLEHAKAHLLDGLDPWMGNVEPADIQAGIILVNLSLDIFPDQEIKIRRGGL